MSKLARPSYDSFGLFVHNPANNTLSYAYKRATWHAESIGISELLEVLGSGHYTNSGGSGSFFDVSRKL